MVNFSGNWIYLTRYYILDQINIEVQVRIKSLLNMTSQTMNTDHVIYWIKREKLTNSIKAYQAIVVTCH